MRIYKKGSSKHKLTLIAYFLQHNLYNLYEIYFLVEEIDNNKNVRLRIS